MYHIYACGMYACVIHTHDDTHIYIYIYPRYAYISYAHICTSILLIIYLSHTCINSLRRARMENSVPPLLHMYKVYCMDENRVKLHRSLFSFLISDKNELCNFTQSSSLQYTLWVNRECRKRHVIHMHCAHIYLNTTYTCRHIQCEAEHSLFTQIHFLLRRETRISEVTPLTFMK